MAGTLLILLLIIFLLQEHAQDSWILILLLLYWLVLEEIGSSQMLLITLLTQWSVCHLLIPTSAVCLSTSHELRTVRSFEISLKLLSTSLASTVCTVVSHHSIEIVHDSRISWSLLLPLLVQLASTFEQVVSTTVLLYWIRLCRLTGSEWSCHDCFPDVTPNWDLLFIRITGWSIKSSSMALIDNAIDHLLLQCWHHTPEELVGR